MFYVYVLKSLVNGKRYAGCTSKAPRERLAEHNKGCNQWTSKNRPFDLVYYEEYENKTKALKREKFLKTGRGRQFLDKTIPQ